MSFFFLDPVWLIQITSNPVKSFGVKMSNMNRPAENYLKCFCKVLALLTLIIIWRDALLRLFVLASYYRRRKELIVKISTLILTFLWIFFCLSILIQICLRIEFKACKRDKQTKRMLRLWLNHKSHLIWIYRNKILDTSKSKNWSTLTISIITIVSS